MSRDAISIEIFKFENKNPVCVHHLVEIGAVSGSYKKNEERKSSSFLERGSSAMTKLRCPCLNVCIHVKENSQKETEGKIFVSDIYNGTFFSNNLLEVELGVGGITKVNQVFSILCIKIS